MKIITDKYNVLEVKIHKLKIKFLQKKEIKFILEPDQPKKGNRFGRKRILILSKMDF